MDEHTNQAHPNDTQTKVTVTEAAQLLGLSAEAVRSRVQRGTLKSTKEKGTVYVLLDADQAHPNGHESATQTDARARLDGDQTRYIASLEGQIEWFRREVERKDTIIMTMAQRIPELEPAKEAAPKPRDGHETASKDRGDGDDDAPQSRERCSWWHRLFGG